MPYIEIKTDGPRKIRASRTVYPDSALVVERGGQWWVQWDTEHGSSGIGHPPDIEIVEVPAADVTGSGNEWVARDEEEYQDGRLVRTERSQEEHDAALATFAADVDDQIREQAEMEEESRIYRERRAEVLAREPGWRRWPATRPTQGPLVEHMRILENERAACLSISSK